MLIYIGPYGGNVSKRFFSETTWTIETKLPRNDHWKVLYKMYVFYVDRKSKMVATTDQSLTYASMSKSYQFIFLQKTNLETAEIF
jgi:hypothetical protein